MDKKNKALNKMKIYQKQISRIILSLITGYFMIFQVYAAGDTAKYQGLLWQISGNGLKKPSYLYGTMHVSDKIAFHLSDSFFIALRGCDMVALEQNPSEWMSQLSDNDFVKLIYSLMEEFIESQGFYKKAFDLHIPDKSVFEHILSYDHNLKNPLLYRFSGFKDDFEENTYLDLFIYQAGKKLKKKVTGLEDYKQVLKLMQKAYEANEEDKEKNKKYNSYYSLRNTRELLDDAYRKGDLDMIDTLYKEMYPSKNFLKYFLHKRNINMVRKMDSLMQTYSLFTGVGAAHLPGEKGMINLLRQKGYTVRAMKRDITKNSMKSREKIDKLTYPVDFYTQYPADSAFTVDLPGKLYQTPGYSGRLQYFYPDMANGAFYTITRLNTFTPLLQKSPSFILKRIDSLLFENIPGKIVHKKKITNNGFPGIDILNKTRRGDYQRYVLISTPLELYVFKMGGTADYVKKSKESKKFFSSIRILFDYSGKLEKYTSGSSLYSVSFPDNFISNATIRDEFSLPSENLQAMRRADSSYFLFMKSTYHDFDYLEEDTFELDALTEKFLDQFSQYTIINQENRHIGQYPALYTKLTCDANDFLFIQCALKGPHYYLLGYCSKSDNYPADFFDSFSLENPEYSEFVTHTDTNLFFNVVTVEQPEDKSFLERSYHNIFSLDYEQDDDALSFMPESKSTTIKSFATSEYIKVNYYRFHKYYSKDSISGFWNTRLERLQFENELSIERKETYKEGNRYIADVYCTDTNSSRGIRIKYILQHGVLYTLFAYMDTISPPTAFIDTFFRTFTPLDTNIGYCIFADKIDTFVNDFFSDSATHEKATQSLSYLDFSDEDAPKIIKILDSYSFNSDEMGLKTEFIEKLGFMKHPDILPFLINQYRKAGDTVTLQLPVLKAIARQKTEKAARAFIRLLKEETPLSTQEYEIRAIFFPFYDSIQLAKYLFPDFMEFTSFPEYKDEVYRLLSLLKDSNVITKKFYEPYKEIIIREASFELKRQFASEAEATYDDYKYDYNIDVEDFGKDFMYKFKNRYNYQSNSSKTNYIKTSNILFNYAVLLTPYYQETKAGEFFDKLKTTNDDNLKLDVSILLLKNNLPVEDSVWAYFASDNSYRMVLYDELKDINRLDKFDSAYANPMEIVKGILYRKWYYSSGMKDSIRFVSKKKITLKGNKEGYVYFFKSKDKDDDHWDIDYIGLQPADTTQFVTDYDFKDKGNWVKEKQTVDEAIQEILKELRYYGRKRAVYDKFSYYRNYLDVF